MNRLTPEERYHRDVWFRQLVDVLYAHLDCYRDRPEYTPSELREAVVLAATMHEQRQIRRPIYVRTEPPNQ